MRLNLVKFYKLRLKDNMAFWYCTALFGLLIGALFRILLLLFKNNLNSLKEEY